MPGVIFKTCDLYDSTVKEYGVNILSNIIAFKNSKMINHMAPAPGDRGPFSTGELKSYPHQLLHAHIKSDVHTKADAVLVYYLKGANPTSINLIGFFSHNDIGIGTPPNPKRTKAFIKRITGQVMR